MSAVLPEFPMPREHPLDPPPQYRVLSARSPTSASSVSTTTGTTR